MIISFIIILFVLLAWMICSSPTLVLALGRWVLHRRYDVSLTGAGYINPSLTYLIVPNHPAIVDPLIVVTELHRLHLDVRPLVDESLFTNRVARHILDLFDAVRVPDFRHLSFRPIPKVRPRRRDSVSRARSLLKVVLGTLNDGRNVLLYPSGHISEDGRESMSNRQLAYNVISQLPAGVRVLGVRTRGLYGSIWSRAEGRPAPSFARTVVKSLLLWPVACFRSKRNVGIHFEDITDACMGWSTCGRAGFNARIERWYDSDPEQIGNSSNEEGA